MSSAKLKKPKTVSGMITYAIRNQPPSDNGVSRIAIQKYLQSEFNYTKAGQVKSSLKKGVENGILIQTGQSFRVAGDPVAERPAEPKIKIEDIKKGSGTPAEAGDSVVVKYRGKLENGTVFDAASKFEFTLGAGEVIKGWDQGIASMKVGGERKIFVPSKLGYGKRGAAPEIPPNSDLFFQVTLKEIK